MLVTTSMLTSVYALVRRVPGNISVLLERPLVEFETFYGEGILSAFLLCCCVCVWKSATTSQRPQRRIKITDLFVCLHRFIQKS